VAKNTPFSTTLTTLFGGWFKPLYEAKRLFIRDTTTHQPYHPILKNIASNRGWWRNLDQFLAGEGG
jgi:hypothetical protein